MTAPEPTPLVSDGAAMKGRSGLARIWHASGYSMAGLKAAYRGEAAFRQLVLLNLILIPVALLLDVSRVERARREVGGLSAITPM